METYTVTLADGTVLAGLRLNGNNLVSDAPLSEVDFEGRLARVTVECSDGSRETVENAELVQVKRYGDEWWFILREPTEEQLYRRALDAEREMMLELMAEHEYMLCLMDLGI